MSRCASGCVIVGEHLADCAGVDDEGRSCRGCLPCPSESCARGAGGDSSPQSGRFPR